MYIITSDFNKFSTSVFKIILKEIKLATNNMLLLLNDVLVNKENIEKI